MHPGEQFSCPVAENHGCISTFTSFSGVRQRVVVEHRHRRFPCSWAQKTNCPAIFCSSSAAHVHARRIHEPTKRVYPCPFADENNCDKTLFPSTDGATQHANWFTGNCDIPVPGQKRRTAQLPSPGVAAEPTLLTAEWQTTELQVSLEVVVVKSCRSHVDVGMMSTGRC